MKDDDTASIWSTAPSYRSSIDPPPYSASGGLPPYSSSYSLPGASSSRSPASSSIAPRGLPPIPVSTSGLPPVALITPGSRTSQSRQYQAVAARRQAKQASKILYNPDFSSRVFPRDRPIRQKAPGLTYDTYSSLHPVLSARDSPRALSTAELFLCTCGRHKDGKNSDPENENHVIDPRAPKPLHNPIFDEPCPSTLAPPVAKQPLTPKAEGKRVIQAKEKKVDDTGIVVGESSNAKIPKDEDAEDPKEGDPLDMEGKSWDFMMSQM